MSGTNRLIKNDNAAKSESQSALTSALENANEEAVNIKVIPPKKNNKPVKKPD